MVEVRNNGVPLLEQFPKAGITQAVVTLAVALAGDSLEVGGAKSNAGSWLSFWSSKKPAARE